MSNGFYTKPWFWKTLIVLAVFGGILVFVVLTLGPSVDVRETVSQLPERVFRQFLILTSKTKPPAAETRGETFVPNQNLEGVVDAFPHHVLQGMLTANGSQDAAKWRFGGPGDQSIPLTGEGFLANGFWVRQADRTLRKAKLEELKDGDYIYVTYFVSPGGRENSQGPAGLSGKTIFGVVSGAKPTENNLELRLLDDPQERVYRLTEKTSFQTEDPTGLFTFVGESYRDFEPGELVRLAIDDKGEVFGVTSVAPRISIAWGKAKIMQADDIGKNVQIGEMQLPVIIDERSLIVRPWESDKRLTHQDIKDGMEISAVFYADGAWLAAKTVEVRD